MTGEISPSGPGVAREPGPGPASRPSADLGRLTADLRSLGLLPGQNLLVHCSLSAIGWVDGGPATLLQAIADVTGTTETSPTPFMPIGLSGESVSCSSRSIFGISVAVGSR